MLLNANEKSRLLDSIDNLASAIKPLDITYDSNRNTKPNRKIKTNHPIDSVNVELNKNDMRAITDTANKKEDLVEPVEDKVRCQTGTIAKHPLSLCRSKVASNA